MRDVKEERKKQARSNKQCTGRAFYLEYRFESHLRQLIFSKVTALGVLLCLVCLFDLACFFLSSFSSLI